MNKWSACDELERKTKIYRQAKILRDVRLRVRTIKEGEKVRVRFRAGFDGRRYFGA